MTLIAKPCKGCSHPTICKTHGCGAVEARRNAAQASQRSQDAIFWDRLQDMPPMEAEQECVMRRERIALENAMLHTERTKINPPVGSTQRKEFADMGVAMSENMAQMTKLNERIKYLRRLQDKVQWRETVRELFGDDAVEQCIVHMEQRWGELYELRRQWAAG
jgi:hypothetical protein